MASLPSAAEATCSATSSTFTTSGAFTTLATVATTDISSSAEMDCSGLPAKSITLPVDPSALLPQPIPHESVHQPIPLSTHQPKAYTAPPRSESFRVKIKPTLRFDITSVPSRNVQSAIDSALGTSGYRGFVLHKPSNSITVPLASLHDAKKLCVIDKIPLSATHHVPVQAYFASGPNILRCVVYRLDKNEGPEEVLDNLYTASHKVLQARCLGTNGTFLLTLEGPGSLPTHFYYHGSVVTPKPFQPRRMYCYNCLREGHIQKACPNPTAVQTSPEGAAAPKCALCKSDDHEITSPLCPRKRRVPRRQPPPGTMANRFALLATEDDEEFPPLTSDSSVPCTYAQKARALTSRKASRQTVSPSLPKIADSDEFASLDQAIEKTKQHLAELTRLRRQRQPHTAASAPLTVPASQLSTTANPKPAAAPVAAIMTLLHQLMAMIASAFNLPNGH